jgi:hypothetical protein
MFIRRTGDDMRGLVVNFGAQFFLFVFVVTAAVGFGSYRGGSEPLEALASVRTSTPFNRMTEAHLRLSRVAASYTRAGTHVESTVKRLDLSKLTMADFGDVEPGR